MPNPAQLIRTINHRVLFDRLSLSQNVHNVYCVCFLWTCTFGISNVLDVLCGCQNSLTIPGKKLMHTHSRHDLFRQNVRKTCREQKLPGFTYSLAHITLRLLCLTRNSIVLFVVVVAFYAVRISFDNTKMEIPNSFI